MQVVIVSKVRRAWRRRWLRRIGGVAATIATWIAVACHAGDYKPWWIERNVVVTSGVVRTNDYAAVNAGQLKWIATNAYLELQANLGGGAGTSVLAVVQSFIPTNNYVPVNVGQLKYVAAPFYDRLIAEGYTNAYPWTTNTTGDDADYSPANIGQLKHVFSFDLTSDTDSDGLADWRESGTGIYLGPNSTGTSATNTDSDGDGGADGAEVSSRTDPNNADTVKPSLVIEFPGIAWRIVP